MSNRTILIRPTLLSPADCTILTHVATATCGSRRIRLIMCAAKVKRPNDDSLIEAIAHVADCSTEDAVYYRPFDSVLSVIAGNALGFANLTPGVIVMDALMPQRMMLRTLAHEVAHLTQPAVDPVSAKLGGTTSSFNPETLAEVLTPYFLMYARFRRTTLLHTAAARTAAGFIMLRKGVPSARAGR